MASSTKNVKLGVCKVFFGGVDLGYTKGGVAVTVKTETKKVEIDQFGKSAINEFIMGRDVTAKVPLAETTLENMVAIMPGATLSTTGGTNATGSVTVATNPVNNDMIVLNGSAITFKTAAAAQNEVTIGGTAAATAINLADALNASSDPAIAAATYSALGSSVSIVYGNRVVYGTAGMKSTEGNAYTLGAGTAGAKVTLSGATLTGGTEATAKSVDVTNAVGTDLLAIAREIRFHPQGKVDTDKTEDFVISLAATSGALNFAYKLEDERIYDVEFTGYPDSATGKVFFVGR